MSVEMHSLTVTLAAASPANGTSAVEHRARIWKAMSELSAAVRAAGMRNQACLRAHDGRGHAMFEATTAGTAFLASLPGIAGIEDHHGRL